MENVSEEWIRSTIEDKWKARQQEVGQFNLAIFGKTGVGKSTLLNAIFGEELAATGVGAPVTRGSHLYRHSNSTLGIIDTEGLELGKDDDQILRELSELVADLRKAPVSEQIHVAWYCVRSRDGRFEDFEEAFVRRLDELRLPVLIVLTQVPTRDGRPHERVVELAENIASRNLPVVGGRPFMTMALSDPFDGPAHGLREVLDATFQVAPDSVREALNHAQKIDLDRKRASCQQGITAAASAAAAAGFSPIPFSDAAIIIPIQLGMLARIAMTYDIPVDRATGMALAMTAAGTGAGRSIVSNLVKFVPGAGTVLGGTINGAVASTLTFAMGHAWVEICHRIASGQLSREVLLDGKLLRGIFLDEFKAQTRKRMPGGK